MTLKQPKPKMAMKKALTGISIQDWSQVTADIYIWHSIWERHVKMYAAVDFGAAADNKLLETHAIT